MVIVEPATTFGFVGAVSSLSAFGLRMTVLGCFAVLTMAADLWNAGRGSSSGLVATAACSNSKLSFFFWGSLDLRSSPKSFTLAPVRGALFGKNSTFFSESVGGLWA